MKFSFRSLAAAVCFLLMAATSQASTTTLEVDQVGATLRSGGYTGGQVFQSFTPSRSNIAGIDVGLYSFSGAQELTLTLWSDDPQTGTVLVSSTVEVPFACPTTDLACAEFRFSPITIVPDEVLFMELTWDGSGAIGASRSNEYAGGTVFCLQPCGNTFGGDINFVTYASPIPLPATVWLLGSALAGLGWVRRR